MTSPCSPQTSHSLCSWNPPWTGERETEWTLDKEGRATLEWTLDKKRDVGAATGPYDDDIRTRRGRASRVSWARRSVDPSNAFFFLSLLVCTGTYVHSRGRDGRRHRRELDGRDTGGQAAWTSLW